MKTYGEKKGLTRIAFKLQQDDDGYPPLSLEHIWAEPCGTNLYKIDNVPFFAYGVSWGDVVKAVSKNGTLIFEELVVSKGHQTIRIILFEDHIATKIRQALQALGCDTEFNEAHGMIAVDVPPTTSLESVRAFLDKGEELEKWEYEESCLIE